MAGLDTLEQLRALEKLLRDTKYHDVEFQCRKGTVSSNRAYLAAREYEGSRSAWWQGQSSLKQAAASSLKVTRTHLLITAYLGVYS